MVVVEDVNVVSDFADGLGMVAFILYPDTLYTKITGSTNAMASIQTMSAMDADLTAMMDSIISDPVDGPLRKSLGLYGINTAMELLEADDPVVATLVYDDHGKDTDLPPMMKIKIKLLPTFL